jgi:hypothetical protein
MLGVIALGKNSQFILRMRQAFQKATQKTVSRYGTKLRPRTLILISFGVDPMTGRAAAKMAGHGFMKGWLLAITGDMFYFAVIMVATLWMSRILGDGTRATLIILVVMIVVPGLIRRVRADRLVTKA